MLFRRLSFRMLAVAAGLLLSTAAWAQGAPLVPDSEFYFDADEDTTEPVVAVEGAGEQQVERLLEQLHGRGRAKAATAQLAHLAMAGGRPELGHDLYREPLKTPATLAS